MTPLEIAYVALAVISGMVFDLLILMFGMYRCELSGNRKNGLCILCYAERRILRKRGEILSLVQRHK